jgi:hypothetical protein
MHTQTGHAQAILGSILSKQPRASAHPPRADFVGALLHEASTLPLAPSEPVIPSRGLHVRITAPRPRSMRPSASTWSRTRARRTPLTSTGPTARRTPISCCAGKTCAGKPGRGAKRPWRRSGREAKRRANGECSPAAPRLAERRTDGGIGRWNAFGDSCCRSGF